MESDCSKNDLGECQFRSIIKRLSRELNRNILHFPYTGKYVDEKIKKHNSSFLQKILR